MAYSPNYDSTDISHYTLPTFTFHSGHTLPSIRLAYRSLNPSSPRKALIPTCYGGLINKTETFTLPGQALANHNVIVVAMLGNGESSSPSNHPNFPQSLDYQDQINAQYQLLTKHLGAESLDVVVGFSMGGQQAYYWAVMHGGFVRNAVVICGSARTSGHNYTFLEGPKTALLNSTDYADGAYKSLGQKPTRGLKAFGRAYCAWLTSGAWYRERQWEKTLGFESIEAFIQGGSDTSFVDWDAEDVLILARQWQAGDVGKVGDRGYEAALKGVRCRVLVMPCRTDQYFAWEDGEREVELLGNRGRLEVLESVWGHIGGGGANRVDTEWMSGRIGVFLGGSGEGGG